MKCHLARTLGIAVVGIGLFAMAPEMAQATTVTYSVLNSSDTTWQYDYTVTNDTLGSALREFTVFFDRTQYANLVVNGSPVDWDSLVAQPDNNLPDDGYFDSLNTATGLAIGASQSGFLVQFDFLGTGSPGSQAFNIVDPDTFDVLDSGSTSAVPLPATFWLLITAFGSLIGRRGISARLRNESMR